jgi:hypothetical protein
VQALLLFAAAGIPAPPPLTADQAIERQRAVVRDAVRYPCGRIEGEEDIVVCAQPDRSVPQRRQAGESFEPEWQPPEEGPWFSWNRGPLSLTCCAIRGSQSSGAGLGLRLRF